MEIIYLPHPVSADEKAMHRKAGYKIVDIRFAPAGYAAKAEIAVEPISLATPMVETEMKVVARRGRRKKD